MRRIRANAIAILTVAWILGTFYYLWQDNKPQSATTSQSRGRGHGQKVVLGQLELHRDDRTIPLIVSEPLWGIKRGKESGAAHGAVAGGAELQESVCCMLMCVCVCVRPGMMRMEMEVIGDGAQLGVTAGICCSHGHAWLQRAPPPPPVIMILQAEYRNIQPAYSPHCRCFSCLSVPHPSQRETEVPVRGFP